MLSCSTYKQGLYRPSLKSIHEMLKKKNIVIYILALEVHDHDEPTPFAVVEENARHLKSLEKVSKWTFECRDHFTTRV